MADSLTLAMRILPALGACGSVSAANWAEAQESAFGRRPKVRPAALVLLFLTFAAAIYPLGRPAFVFGVLSNPGAGLFREFAFLRAFLLGFLPCRTPSSTAQRLPSG